MGFKIGDEIIVVKNNVDGNWDFLIGKVGTVIQTDFYRTGVIVQFNQDEKWADKDYFCTFDEIEHYNIK